MNTESHISSLVVQYRPAVHDTLLPALQNLPGVETPLGDARGKLVVVAETHSEAALAQLIDNINRMSGVIGVNLVYHHCEDTESLNQEMPA